MELEEKIKLKKAEIAEMQKRLDWHARRGRPDGTTEHDVMRRLVKELSVLMEEMNNGKSELEGLDIQTGQLDGVAVRSDRVHKQR